MWKKVLFMFITQATAMHVLQQSIYYDNDSETAFYRASVLHRLQKVVDTSVCTPWCKLVLICFLAQCDENGHKVVVLFYTCVYVFCVTN